MKIVVSGPLVGAGFTQGSVIFAGVGGVLTEDNPNFFWDDANNRLGLGTTAAPLYPLHLIRTLGSLAANQAAASIESYAVPTANEGTFGTFGLLSQVFKNGAFNLTTSPCGVRGVYMIAGNLGTGTLSEAAGFFSAIFNLNTGTITHGFNYYCLAPVGVSAANPITNMYALYSQALKVTGVTNAYGIYLIGPADISYINGFLGIGTAAPGARLDLPAGTATAGTAPLMLRTGTSLTTAVAGSVEFTTDDLFFTITAGTARKRIIFADPVGGLTNGRVPYATTNGRLTDDLGFEYDPAFDRLFVETLRVASSAQFASLSFQITAAGLIGNYKGVPTEGWGVPSIVDDIALTNQGADIASTNFTNAAVAGTYRLGYYLVCTTAAVATGTIAFAVTYNDGTAARTLTGVGVALTATTNKSTKYTNTDIDGTLIKLGSGSIAYSVTITGLYSTAKYALYATLERLS